MKDCRYIVANVGDSRLYHFDGTTLTCVTTDHSLVEALVAEGAITREEALTHPMRNVITRAIGSGFRVDVDLFDRCWKKDDILLLCSDGLHGILSTEEMHGILSEGLPLQAMCDKLIEAASCAGSRDNITAVLARCEGGDCT